MFPTRHYHDINQRSFSSSIIFCSSSHQFILTLLLILFWVTDPPTKKISNLDSLKISKLLYVREVCDMGSHSHHMEQRQNNSTFNYYYFSVWCPWTDKYCHVSCLFNWLDTSQRNSSNCTVRFWLYAQLHPQFNFFRDTLHQSNANRE